MPVRFLECYLVLVSNLGKSDHTRGQKQLFTVAQQEDAMNKFVKFK